MRTYLITTIVQHQFEPHVTRSHDPWGPLADILRKYEGLTDPDDPVSIITWLNENGRLYHLELKQSERRMKAYTGEEYCDTVLKYFACVDSEEDATLLKLFTGAISEEEEIAWLLSS